MEDRVVPSVYDGLTIPDTGIRLLFNPATLARAKGWFANNPFTPASDDALGNAFVYQMTGNSTYAQNAITQLMAFTISQDELDGVASDTYRWAQWVPVVYDWCYDQMTADQISTFTARYNYYTSTLIAKDWGGPTMPSNNYFWGYWSNELDWGIASYGRNASAPTFIDDAVITRWNAFSNWNATTGNGGIPQEGTQYGRYMLEYPIVALTTAVNEGLNLVQNTSFYQDAAYYLLYATSPMPVAQSGNGSFYQVYPFNDDDNSLGNPPANDGYYADFMTFVAQQYSGTPLGGYARQWLTTVGASADYLLASVDGGGSTQDYSSQPTEYYAPGPGYLYAKDGWGSGAMAAFFQLGGLDGVGHSHLDMGAFDILQNGQWLSKQTTGYGSDITGYDGQGTASVSDTLATNGIYVGGLGEAAAYANANPTVTRLETQQNYTFASVDLTQAYLSSDDRFNNPFVQSVVRDFIFIRPLDVLLVFDRVATTSSSAPVTFLLHFPNTPTITGPHTVVGTNGSQALQLTTLTPASQSAPTRNIFDEAPPNADSGTDYQKRLEETYTGQSLSYLINVLQGRDVNGAQVTATMTENATSFTITLTDPSGRKAVVTLQKGATSAGGQFGYSPTGGSPNMGNLATGIESIQVTTNGVAWGTPSFTVSAPATSVAGTAFNVTVTALDSSGHVNPGYTGTVHFSSSDPRAALPVNYHFTAADAGVHVFQVTLKSAGSEGITAADTYSDFVFGTTHVTVTAAAVHSFRLNGFPASAQAGVHNNFALIALDAYGNVATSYTGTVHFTSSDLRAKLPADYTFGSSDAGVHVFTGTLNTVGTRSITGTDKRYAYLTATQSGIVVDNKYTLLGTVTPSNPNDSDANAVEVGVRFYADTTGTIRGIRFYKGTLNTGVHVAHLWKSDGTLLATATFTGETKSGWEQVYFSHPVTITAGSTYIASYHTNSGHYAASPDFFDSQLDSGPLHGFAGNNGVFSYGPSGSFPSQSYQNTNYYVDVLFKPANLAVLSVNPINGATNISRNTSVLITLNVPLDSSSVNATTVQLLDSAGHLVSATVTYDASTLTVKLTPTSPLLANMKYRLVVHGGGKGIMSVFGQALSASFTSYFTTGLT